MSTAANTDLGPTPSGGEGETGAASERAVLDQRIGLVVAGRYKILRTLGSGGMGGVYEAVHEGIGRKVAIKCLHAEFAKDRGAVERFRREARAATAIGNEHIVDVTDVGELPDGAPFLVMELLSGNTLGDVLREHRAMRVPRAIHIARQICGALADAHDKGIIHRDLKPDNVFLMKRGDDKDFVKVLDFGISKSHAGDGGLSELTRTGMAIGTPSYMSPEQAQGLREVDGRTDVWALGVILYEMLSERRPFVADTYPRLLMHIVGGAPHPLSHWRRDIPEELEAVVMKCLEKSASDRISSMRELSDALAAFVGSDSVPELAAADPSGAPVGSERSSEGRAARRGTDPEISRDAIARASAATTGRLRPGTAEPGSPSAEAAAIVARGTSARGPMLGLGLAAVVGLAIAGVWAFGSGGAPAEPLTTEPTPPATATAPATTNPPRPEEPTPPPAEPLPVMPDPPPVTEVHHRIESRPAGATVLRGDTELGTTPLDVSFPEGEAVELTVRMSGRRTVTHTIAADDPETIAIVLEPRRGGGESQLPRLAEH